MIRIAALFVALAAVAGCREPAGSSANDAAVVGQWAVTGIDSTGAAGELQIGWNTPAGMYEMVLTQPVADSFSSAGKYSWDGTTLVLTDSAGKLPMSGPLVSGQLTLQRGAHSLRLIKLIQTP